MGTYVCRSCRSRFGVRPVAPPGRSVAPPAPPVAPAARPVTVPFLLGVASALLLVVTVLLFVCLFRAPTPQPGQPAPAVRQPPGASAEIRPPVDPPALPAVSESPPPPPQPGVPQPPKAAHGETVIPPPQNVSLPVPAAASPRALTPRQVYDMVNVSVVTLYSLDESLEKRALGTGFFVTDDGVVATNLHVIEGSTFVDVVSPEGWRARSTGFLAADPERDVAIIRVDRRSVAICTDPAPLPIGSRVYAMGNPEGFANTLSEGIVSGMRRLVDLDRDEVSQLIQTTAAVSHGSSGGPLLSDTGEVVGVTSSSLTDAQNINFAIPIVHVQRLLRGGRGPVRRFTELPHRLNNVPEELSR